MPNRLSPLHQLLRPARVPGRWLASSALRLVLPLVLAMATATGATAANAVPEGYPPHYEATIAAARKEGKVVVYSTTDLSVVASLIRDFEQCFPGVKVEYNDLNSDDLYERFLAETANHEPSADVIWSSAMDMQMKLANDDFAARYHSPEADALPTWAVWRDTAYGTTFEPAVFVYNKREVSPQDVPQTHADINRLLSTQREKYANKVTTYDIERSGVGFLLATQDSRVQSDFWELVGNLGRSGVRLETNTSVMMQRIASGQYFLGYNLIGSYALTRAKHDPSIGVVLPSDYTLVMSRIALLSKKAEHPNAGKLWLDYLLSKRGQTVLSAKAELFSIRSDVPGEYTAAALRKSHSHQLKAITVALPLLVFLDRAKRHEFIKHWNRASREAN